MSFFPQPQIEISQKVRHGVSLAISLVFLGWVLAVYHMPLLGWAITLISLLHLSKSGRGAIPLALTWINIVVWVAAYKFAMPVGFIWRNAKYWSASLIFLWVMATVIVLALAKVPTLYSLKSASFLRNMLPGILMSCGLGCGFILYQQGLSPQ